MTNQKNRKILILHGWQSNPARQWFSNAKDRFEKDGYEVFVPKMPGGYFPKLKDWLKVVADYHPDENWILIGHSLGGVTILKYLEKNDQKISQAILVATPFEPMKFNPIANFFEDGFDFEKIKRNADKIDIVTVDEDPVVPLSHGQDWSKNLDAPLHTIRGFSHSYAIDLDLLEKLIS